MSERIGTVCLMLTSSIVVLLQTFSTWASGAIGYALSAALLLFGFALIAFLHKRSDAS